MYDELRFRTRSGLRDGTTGSGGDNGGVNSLEFLPGTLVTSQMRGAIAKRFHPGVVRNGMGGVPDDGDERGDIIRWGCAIPAHVVIGSVS